MRRIVLALALTLGGPALAGELKLTAAETKVGFPYVGEYVLPEGEEEREYMNRGNRSYLNPEYEGDWKKQICILDFLRSEVRIAKKRDDIDNDEQRQFNQVINRDRQHLVKSNREAYDQNGKFFHGYRRGYGHAGIDSCNG